MKQSAELVPKKISYSIHDYTTLKELWNNIQHCQKQCDEKRKSFSDAINEEEELQSASSIIQNRQIRLRIYREQIHQAKNRIRNAQMRLTAIEENNEKKASEELELSSIAEGLRGKCNLEVESLKIKQIPITKIKNELIFRRRYMLFELYMIYFAETSMDRREDKTCPCTKFDTIRGMHLPVVATKNGHTEIEMTAALGHLVNALNIFCKIMDYRLLFPVFFKGSKSFLLEPKQHQIYNLFDPFSRSHRERYAQAISFFNRSINQLRHDLGMPTKDHERPIQNFQELLLYCIGQVNQPPAHFVPRTSIFAVSSVVPDYQKFANDRASFQSSVKLRRNMDDDQSILDVVSAKNETFDVQKLMSDCPESSLALEASTSESPAVVANAHHSHSLIEEDEEEVLIEPRFKYNRLLSSMPDKDTISCFAIHDRIIAVGCGSGRIRIFDILGNLKSNYTTKQHRCAVSQIALDKSGSYLISCANDSTVSIFGIGCTEFNYTVQLGQSARSVAIAEDFIKKGCQKFAIGERRLLIYEKGFFSKYSEKVLYEGKERDGLIGAVSWKGDNLAFTNETGTRIYNFKLHRFLGLVQPLHNSEPYYSSRFPPHHSWFNDHTLAVGWGNTITVVGLKHVVPEPNAAPIKRIEIVHQFQLPNFHVAGVSFTVNPVRDGEKNWKEISLFGIKIVEQKSEKNDSASTISQISGRSVPQSVMAVPVNPGQQLSVALLLILPSSVDKFIIAAEDDILMKQPEQTFLREFHLGAIPEDSVYYLLGPLELIEARPCSVDDRISWFLENGLYVDATNCALAHKDELIDNTVSDVGRKLIEELTNKGDFEMAASYLTSICGRHKEEWEYYVGLFEKHGRVLNLVPYLPQKQPQLEPECYESILISALYGKAELFLKLIILLPSDLYRIAAITQNTLARLKQQLSREEKIPIIQALARLFAHERQFDKALALYLQLKDTGIFSFIRQYHLFESVKDRVVELMEINTDMAIRLLLDHEGEIADYKIIIPQLGKIPRIQMEYLNQLLQRGEGLEYSDLLVKLLAENAPDRLLPFLRKSDNYDLDKAIEVCKKSKLQHELVFLLGRSGNRLAALETIIEQMERIDLGIEFCAEHADPDLWQRLIELAMKKPEHVSKILTVAGTFVDPLLVIEKIPPNMEVPNLQAGLHKVLRDSELQVSLISDCKATSQNDIYEKFEKFINRPAVLIDSWNECLVCGKLLLSSQTDILLQGCGHQFHVKCVKIPEVNPFNENDEQLCKRTSFLAFSENDPDPPPFFCPICNKKMPAEFLKVYNILLLGQTGTGKSTFINSISNYFMFETLQEAIDANQPSCAVSCKFDLTFKDVNKKNKSITVGMRGIDPKDVDNERSTDAGQSRTLQPRVYSFKYDDIEFNVIDVPGTADTNGIAQDMINKQAIVNQIGRFKEIHGICIMVKENTNTMTTELIFGINEMLSIMNKKAIKNIFFVVTHASSSGFTPGQASASLGSYIQRLNRERNISLDFNENVFCVDNDAFRFLVGWNQSREFQENHQNKIGRYENSWEESREAVFKLFQKMYTMNAYNVEEMMGVARANTVIQCIMGPLSTVIGLISKASSPEYREQTLNSLTNAGTLNKPDAVTEKLKTPQLICTHKECLKIYVDPKTKKRSFDFSNPCHKDCLLKGVVKARIGDPGLKECQKFGLDDNCRHCKHSYETHMHVPFKVTQTTSQVEAGKILSREQAEQRYQAFFESLIREKNTIVECLIILSTFLRENAIIEYNNIFEHHLEAEMRVAETSGDHAPIQKLNEILADFRAKIKMINTSKLKGVKSVTIEQVTEALRKLFILPLYGNTIHSLFEKELPPCEAADAKDFLRCNVRYIPNTH